MSTEIKILASASQSIRIGPELRERLDVVARDEYVDDPTSVAPKLHLQLVGTVT